jgi:hypothetical protein
MIQATSLRLGNYIYYNENELLNILMIDKSLLRVAIGIDPEHGDFLCSCDRISGIPLTEELLLKMGFEKFGNYYHNKINEVFSIVTRAGRFYVCWDDKDYLIQVDTVHALQNAFYLLTRQELTLS